MKFFTFLTFLALATNAFAQGQSTPSLADRLIKDDHFGQEYPLDKELKIMAKMALDEIKAGLDNGVITQEKAEELVEMVGNVVEEIREQRIVNVHSGGDHMMGMLRGCGKYAIWGGLIGSGGGPGMAIAFGMTGCFYGISIGVFEMHQ